MNADPPAEGLIEAEKLTTFAISDDGARFRFNCVDAGGVPVGLCLPVEALNELIMTLPRIAQEALRRRHCDPNLRVVYPAAGWRIEGDAALSDKSIVTLRTGDGFEVSFTLSPAQLQELGEQMGKASRTNRRVGKLN
ncbi:MAG TPA: hypothetical protein VG900_10535 [Hyphomicrobiaceae bacterium]|nr:hypothetical protein [Hyphomicrobiaceae bacterium]